MKIEILEDTNIFDRYLHFISYATLFDESRVGKIIYTNTGGIFDAKLFYPFGEPQDLRRDLTGRGYADDILVAVVKDLSEIDPTSRIIHRTASSYHLNQLGRLGVSGNREWPIEEFLSRIEKHKKRDIRIKKSVKI